MPPPNKWRIDHTKAAVENAMLQLLRPFKDAHICCAHTGHKWNQFPWNWPRPSYLCTQLEPIQKQLFRTKHATSCKLPAEEAVMSQWTSYTGLFSNVQVDSVWHTLPKSYSTQNLHPTCGTALLVLWAVSHFHAASKVADTHKALSLCALQKATDLASQPRPFQVFLGPRQAPVSRLREAPRQNTTDTEFFLVTPPPTQINTEAFQCCPWSRCERRLHREEPLRPTVVSGFTMSWKEWEVVGKSLRGCVLWLESTSLEPNCCRGLVELR